MGGKNSKAGKTLKEQPKTGKNTKKPVATATATAAAAAAAAPAVALPLSTIKPRPSVATTTAAAAPAVALPLSNIKPRPSEAAPTLSGPVPADSSRPVAFSVLLRPKMPSLLDLEGGVVSDHFMQAVDTWPSSRINILEKIREVLDARFVTVGTRDISSLGYLFASMETVGAGAFGVVYKGCVRAWDAEMRPITPEACVQYQIQLADAQPAVAHSVPLVIKIMEPPPDGDNAGPAYSGHDADFTEWSGATNSVREVMMGRLLNLLVQVGATPHLPLVYEPFRIIKKKKKNGKLSFQNGFSMELAHMSFANFMSSKILASVTDAEAIELLNVAILQICNGLLCAHKHYDFRHNDFHSNNAMMTFITDTTYTYKVKGQFYEIPNYGMCWKLIDFGYSASPIFHRHDLAHSAMHSAALSVVNTYFDLTDHAMECYDMLRLLTSVKYSVWQSTLLSEARKAQLNTALDSHVVALQKLSQNSSKGGSLAAAHDKWEMNNARGRDKLLQTTVEFSNLLRSEGLLEKFFCDLASRYLRTTAPAAGAIVFDASTSPFEADGSILLHGIGTTPIRIQSQALGEAKPEHEEVRQSHEHPELKIRNWTKLVATHLPLAKDLYKFEHADDEEEDVAAAAAAIDALANTLTRYRYLDLSSPEEDFAVAERLAAFKEYLKRKRLSSQLSSRSG